MPTFDYECKECGKTFEEFHFPNEPDLESCKYCGGDVVKLMGCGSAIIFKGSGFYVTDSKKSQASVKPIKKQKKTV